jgi:chromosome segregation ATPase
MYNDKRFQSELARAEATLKELEAKRRNIASLIDERKAERGEIDNQRHILERTGDINKLMVLKTHSIGLDKSILELTAAEIDCRERIESARRYLQGLKDRLDKLQSEAASLSQKLSTNEVPAEVLSQVQTNLRRLQMQIEALAGAK